MFNNINSNYDIIEIPIKHFSAREKDIELIIIHSIGLNFDEIIDVFNKLKVSSHYLIPEDNAENLVNNSKIDIIKNYNFRFPQKIPIIKFVDEENSAFHAGTSHFSDFNCGLNTLNHCSIGIEFQCSKYSNKEQDWYYFPPFVSEQEIIAIDLITHLITKHNIAKYNILAHSSISVGRKTDPGPLFFWNELHNNGLSYIPNSRSCNINLRDEKKIIKFIQQKIFDIGFIQCPQTGFLDDLTQQHIDAFIMQFASDLWLGKNSKISNELLERLNGFDSNIFKRNKI